MLPFLERLLQLLSQGGFTSTYKYAVLLALVDLCAEEGQAPSSLTTAQLARRVLELYWPQARVYRRTQAVLQQSAGKQASILRLIEAFRDQHPNLSLPSRQQRSLAYEHLLTEIEWVLVEYPLPRLQRVGGAEERFLYEIHWDEQVSRADFMRHKRGAASSFDNRILFKPGAAASLMALASVLRPMFQQRWMEKLRQLNKLPETELEAFLFGVDRARLKPLQEPLRALQAGSCFYCEASLRGASQVDHFLPWSRYPDDGLDNLVLAHDTCNNNKSHFLAALGVAARWERRSRDRSEALAQIAGEARWVRDQRRTFNVVAGVYQSLPEGVWLWSGRGRLKRLEAPELAQVRLFGQGLLAGG